VTRNVQFNTDVCSAILIAVSSVLLYIIPQYDLLQLLLLTILYTFHCSCHWIALSWPALTVLLAIDMLVTKWNVRYNYLWVRESFDMISCCIKFE
jgi:hypothetical protein